MPSTSIAAPTASPSTDRLTLGAEVVRGAAPGSFPLPGQCNCGCTHCFEAEASTHSAGCAAFCFETA